MAIEDKNNEKTAAADMTWLSKTYELLLDAYSNV